MNKKTLLGIILLFACTEKEETTIIHSHPNLPEPDFKLNLESDSGENLDYVTINWQNSEGEMVITDSNGPMQPITENYYTYENLQPGTLKDVFFQLTL